MDSCFWLLTRTWCGICVSLSVCVRLHACTLARAWPHDIPLATRIWFHLLAASSRKNGMEFHIAFGNLGLSFWVDVALYVYQRAFFESHKGVGDLQSAHIFPNCPTEGGHGHYVIAYTCAHEHRTKMRSVVDICPPVSPAVLSESIFCAVGFAST